MTFSNAFTFFRNIPSENRKFGCLSTHSAEKLASCYRRCIKNSRAQNAETGNKERKFKQDTLHSSSLKLIKPNNQYLKKENFRSAKKLLLFSPKPTTTVTPIWFRLTSKRSKLDLQLLIKYRIIANVSWILKAQENGFLSIRTSLRCSKFSRTQNFRVP